MLDVLFRLSFWLSNAIVLREIVSQAFGDSCQSSPLRQLAESNGKHTASKWNESTNSKQVNGHLQLDEDWQDTETFISALEKVESYVFSRIVESVWWQVLYLFSSLYAVLTFCIYIWYGYVFYSNHT